MRTVNPFPQSEIRVRVLEGLKQIRRIEWVKRTVDGVFVAAAVIAYFLDHVTAALVLWGLGYVVDEVFDYRVSKIRDRVEEAREERSQELAARVDSSDVNHFTHSPDGRVHIVAADFRDGSTQVVVVKWLVAVGAQVRQRDPIAEVMYDSWTLEFTAPIAGRVDELSVEPSKDVAIGTTLCILSPA